MISSFFRITDDLSIPNRWHLKSPMDAAGVEIDERQFIEGRKLPSPGPLRLPLRREGVPLDFSFADSDVPVIRAHVAAGLEHLAPGSFQRIPVTIDGYSDAEFEILNVTRLASCLDPVRSDIMYWTTEDGRPDKTGKPRMVTKLRIRPECVREMHVFRVEEWPIAMIVSAEVHRWLTDQGVAGAQFLPVT